MLDIDKHKTILVQILKEIYSDTALGPILGFKGGTAAYLFYDLGRFSTDLDFDILDERKKERVFDKIKKIINDYGLTKESYKKKNTLLFVISYSETARNIKIEISTRNFGSRYELKNYLGISMQVMIKEDMFAHKLVAMTERGKTANRDIFDVWFFLKNNWDINKRIVEVRTGLMFKEYLKKCVDFISSLPAKNILTGMGELLNEKQKFWVKDNLKKDALFLLKVRLENER